MNVFLDSIGCRLNQSEIERYARQFRAAGHTIVDSPERADLVVVNTCAVTREAASDSRQKIRQAARAGNAQIILTGCWSTLEPDAAADLPNVVRVVPNMDKDQLVFDFLDLPTEAFDEEPLAREPLPGSHARTRAFIKVQDGCDNHCTFCITRVARGRSRSRPVAEVLADVLSAREGGSREVVLTGVQLGGWGKDLEQPRRLQYLVQAILDETDVERVRLSSLEPWDLDEDFFRLWENPRMCRHLHLPLQSGSAATLRRMARKTTPAEYAALLDLARGAAPDMAISTDVITGFPGETDAEFAESMAFIERMQFAGGHVFTYSPRPATPAGRLPGQVPKEIRKQRNAEVRRLFVDAQLRFQERFLGAEVEVLWESETPLEDGTWAVSGLTDHYLRVFSAADRPLWNQISRVVLKESDLEGMRGVILQDRRTVSVKTSG